jgi:hypothetical protein
VLIAVGGDTGCTTAVSGSLVAASLRPSDPSDLFTRSLTVRLQNASDGPVLSRIVRD